LIFFSIKSLLKIESWYYNPFKYPIFKPNIFLIPDFPKNVKFSVNYIPSGYNSDRKFEISLLSIKNVGILINLFLSFKNYPMLFLSLNTYPTIIKKSKLFY